ncbi:sulfotransferase family 2 domain-containing protein [Winogradskyella forsetii]|uniref:sulfotransferase family 2 domain-containing protein n=1 Tax=Winogradskyella forsetii TaxID=2686077 RepID=UPI0015B871A1|nr:sulfotransferase family 2 domain-containing protein [Winogradskyella forsetii]
MPFSKKNKFVFIHVPKVAGTSIEKHLGIYSRTDKLGTKFGFGQFKIDNVVYSLQHVSLEQLLELNLLTKYEVDNFFKFSFVRNPWDRAVSGYNWQKKVLKKKITFREYLILCNKHFKINKDKKLINLENCHFVPQSWFVFDKNDCLMVDFVGKYEQLQVDMNFVLSKLNIEITELSNDNKGNSLPYFFYYLDVRNFFLVKRIYFEDIVNFNYHFFKSNSCKLFFQRLLHKFKNKI